MNIIYIAVIPYEISGKKQKLKLNVKKNTLLTERASHNCKLCIYKNNNGEYRLTINII